MKQYIYIILQILLLVGNISQACEETSPREQSDLGLSVYGSIQEQRASYCKKDTSSSKRIIPENIHDETTVELQGDENIYRVPKAKNPLGFLCGRCNFIGLYSLHPNRDCYTSILRPDQMDC